jgi:hypothetical protein
MASFTARLVKFAKNESLKLLKARKREGSLEASQHALDDPLERSNVIPISTGRLDMERDMVGRVRSAASSTPSVPVQAA